MRSRSLSDPATNLKGKVINLARPNPGRKKTDQQKLRGGHYTAVAVYMSFDQTLESCFRAFDYQPYYSDLGRTISTINNTPPEGEHDNPIEAYFVVWAPVLPAHTAQRPGDEKALTIASEPPGRVTQLRQLSFTASKLSSNRTTETESFKTLAQ
ncbi:hypothetical protein SODALDRAFT_376846 [Sodiomyces alkalinus F11]|uniref:Uncharacterized protein n=1 Tax=Sodiomyces alkalinus (strain CBS 110278 / VKM F-3762 / F11) TaxID=1314773 RepID=A0A3N2Q332_SODAK|nr:hypothetical protein SODALDRAFT_376846 [Sodiomyces alkalinus F11]ROT41137.1 hypothetical protein SODALDRAFT_376846 [Sodiomyces alkalinus F11]